MSPQIKRIPKHQIRHRTALYAYLPLLDYLLQVGVLGQSESMAYALGAHQDGVHDVLVLSVSALACVQDHWETVLLLGFSYVLHKVKDRRHIIFFINHVKANNKFRDSLTLLSSLHHLECVLNGQDFQRTYYQSNGKQRVVFFNLFQGSMQDLKFILHTYGFPFIINHHAKYVSQFQDKNILFDKHFAHLGEYFLKELLMIVQF